MGRIRTVKPDLFIHDELFDLEAQVKIPVRLAFIGLLTVADREGRFVWNHRQLKTDVLPYDDVNFEDILIALEEAGFIFSYTVNGKRYGCITTFKEHQRINSREAQSQLPAPTEQNTATHMHAPAPTRHCNANACNCNASAGNAYREREKEKEREKEQEKENNIVESDDSCRADAQPDVEPADVTGEIILADTPLEPTGPPTKTGKSRIPPEDIESVFLYWQQMLHHPQAKLDDKRRKFIRNALKTGYSVNDLKTAIHGCSLTPFNMGENDRGQKYDGLHVILKDADQIDRFIHNSMHQGAIHENRQRYELSKLPTTGANRAFTADDFDLDDTSWRQYVPDDGAFTPSGNG